MTSGPEGGAELDRQRAEIDAVFRARWAPLDRGPRVLTAPGYAEARRIIGQPGRTWLDPVVTLAVRDGAQPGDELPPLQPDPHTGRLITEADVRIIGSGEGQRVAVLFPDADFPGARFGHRFEPAPAGGGAARQLIDEIKRGALHRMMGQPPPGDSAGIVWTTWGTPNSDPELEPQLTRIGAACCTG